MLDNRFALKDTLKCSGLALALFAITMIFPIISIFVCLVPGFIAVATYRNSLKMGILGAFVVVLGSALLLGIGGILVAVELCSMGLLIGELMRRKIQPAYVITWAAVLFVGIFMGYILLSGQTSMREALDTMLDGYKQMIIQEGGQMLEILGGEDYLTALMLSIKRVFPSFLVIMGIICGFINYFFAGNMLMKMYLKRQVPMIAEFTLPGNIYIGIIIIMALTLMINASGFIYGESLFLNLSVVFSLLFYLQGFACVYHFSMTRMKPGLRNVLMVAIVIFIPFYSIVEIIGFIDAGFNIRRLNR